MIEILIAKKSARVVFLGRPGGMRRPPGGIIGGAKNSLFELCRYLNISWLYNLEIWLVASASGDRSGTPGSAPPGRAADLIASRIPPGRVVESRGVDDMMQKHTSIQ